MKILIFADAANSHIEKWLRYFKDNQLDVEIATLTEGSFQEYPLHLLKSESYRKRKNNREYNRQKVLFEVYPQLKKIVKQVKPDIVHAHYASSFGLYAALTGFHPFILSVWGSDITDFPNKNLISRLIIKYVISKADVICPLSEYLEKMTRQFTAKKQQLVYWGVDTELFKPQPDVSRDPEKFVFGTVKAFYKYYGIDHLIKAASLIKKHIPRWELWLGGSGVEEENLKKLAHNLQLEKEVKFLGRIPQTEVPKILSGMDAAVVPSLRESFGVSAAEASACELPVIVSNIGGLPEIIQDSQTGYLVKPADPEAIAEKLLHLYRNPCLRYEMGKAGREFIKSRFEWKLIASKMIRIYNNVAGRA